jgi:nitrite reductase (NADH) small subunit
MPQDSAIPIFNLGSVSSIPAGQGRCFIVAGEEVAVFRQRDGKIFATQNRCPHRRGPLSEGIVGGNKVICPLHAHQFDLETGKGNESIECVELYHVEEVNGQMLLSMESVAV